MTLQAIIAIKAAKGFKTWGAYAARRYAEKCGISPRLYRIARQCEATIRQPFERRDALYSSLNGLI